MENHISTLKCQLQECLQLYLDRSFESAKAFFLVLLLVLQCLPSPILWNWPVHECVVVCRKKRMHHHSMLLSEEHRSCRFLYMAARSPASSCVALIASHRLILRAKKMKCFKDDSYQQQRRQEILQAFSTSLSLDTKGRTYLSYAGSAACISLIRPYPYLRP